MPTTSLDLLFVAAGTLYRYGVSVGEERIAEEWLVEVIGSRARTIFERVTNEAGEVEVQFGEVLNASEKLKALKTVGGPPGQSFLATIRTNLDIEAQGQDLSSVIEWFAKTLVLVGAGEPIGPVAHLLFGSEEMMQFASEFLWAASTGVSRLEATREEISIGDLLRILPPHSWPHVQDPKLAGRLTVVDLGNGRELTIDRKEEGQFHSVSLQSVHEGGSLEVSDESDGTRRLLDLLPALYNLNAHGGVYVIDEIDRSLHPHLILKFVEFFISRCAGQNRQLIMTTHESNLLDLDLLRRDEIWFAEKDERGATHLYSMSDFKVRTDHEVRKHYLQGRFGAIPFLGDLDRLIRESQPQP